jgi:DNA invertase Pin-like site-specific DNA recombinase
VKAIGYVRRSKASEEKTVSLQEQGRQIEQYCAGFGLDLCEIVSHDGVSGAKRERWYDIKAAVKRHGAQAVVIYNLDRLSRDAVGLLDNLTELARSGTQVHEVGQGAIDMEDPTKRLTTGMRGMFDEFFRHVVKKKTKDALAYKKSKGSRYSHHAPYGYRFVDAKFEPCPVERAGVAFIQTCIERGFGLDRTITALRAAQYQGRMGRMTIYRVMKKLQEEREASEIKTETK